MLYLYPQGLKYVAARDLLGKERMAGAGLLLRLLAGRALLALGQLAEAEVGAWAGVDMTIGSRSRKTHG